MRERLLNEFSKWKGTRYKWGGTGTKGIDCSALTQKLYAAVMKKALPRTTGEQMKKGTPVSVGKLEPGDLVFFQTKKSVRHVGVYVGSNQFIHASGHLGVTLSDLHTPFWSAHFEAARRISGAGAVSGQQQISLDDNVTFPRQRDPAVPVNFALNHALTFSTLSGE